MMVWSRRFIGAVAAAGAILFGPTPSLAQVNATVQWLYPAETIYLSDFDPFSPGRQPDLFQIRIQNVGGRDQELVLQVRVTMERPNTVAILTATTGTFRLTEPMRSLTNRDLATTGQDVSVKDFVFRSEADDLTEQLRQSGRFPAGTYRFDVEIRTPQGFILSRAEIRRDLVAPTRVQLLGPGAPFADAPPVVTSPSPTFLWTTDAGLTGADAASYRIRVARVDGTASAEEAMGGFAVWDAAVQGTRAVYPGSAGAIPLVPGASYAWQVIREVRTSGGTEQLASPIYRFRMSGGGAGAGLGSGTGSEDTLTRQMQQLGEVLGLGSELAGFEVQGTILVDGVPTSMDALLRLLRQILSGEASVHSITVR